MRHAILTALSLPRFATYTAGQTVSQIGLWTQQVAVSWLAWDLTHSETWLGIVVFAQFVPALIMSPIAGALADRLDRLLLAVVASALAAGQAALLWVLSSAGLLTIGPLIGCVLFLGLVTSLSLPTMRVVLRYLVPEALLPAAISINSITINIARFTGPALAGLFIYWNALDLAFLLNALSYFAIILPLLAFRRRKLAGETTRAAETRTSLLTDMKEGAVYAWTDRYARMMLGIYLAYAMLGRPAVDLLPAVVAQVLHGDGETLALLTSIFGIVAVLAGVLLAGVTRRETLEGVMRGSLTLLGLAVLGLALAPSLAFAVVAIVIYGAGQVAVNVTTQTLLQLQSEDRVRGRMMALHFMMFRGGAAFGGLCVGMLAERIGLDSALALTAMGLFVMFALTLVWRR